MKKLHKKYPFDSFPESNTKIFMIFNFCEYNEKEKRLKKKLIFSYLLLNWRNLNEETSKRYYSFKSVRHNFFKRSAEKIECRTDPDHEVYRDLRVIFPGACPGKRVQGLPWGSYQLIFQITSNLFGIPEED